MTGGLSNSEDGEDDAIRDMVMNYLRRHPDAKDTLRGIMEWWLLEEAILGREAAVRKALESLVTEGRIVTYRDSQGEVYYQLNRERQRI